jgi:hypothetical protein
MDYNDEANRRLRDELDGFEDIKATVKLALQFIDNNIMSEKEALKYFNLPKAIFDQFKTTVTD